MAKWSKTKAPGTQMSQGRSFEQPSPEVCPQLAYVLTAMLGMARMGYCENLSLCDSAEDNHQALLRLVLIGLLSKEDIGNFRRSD
jgi:hypothetical protein